MQMLRWMCHVSLRNSSEELRNRLGIANTTDILRRTRLRWFGIVERMDKVNPVNKSSLLRLATREGQQCKRWNQIIKDDLRILRLQRPGEKPSEKLPSNPC